MPDKDNFLTGDCPWEKREWGFDDTYLAVGSSANGTTIQKFSYLIIPSSVTKVLTSSLQTSLEIQPVIPRDYVLFSPNSKLTEIGNDAFCKNECFEEIIIPNGCTKIGFSAFSDCSMLSKVYIPKSVVEIGTGAFLSGVGQVNDWIPALRNITVYYEGTEDEWNEIDVYMPNTFENPTILYEQSISDMQ